MTGSPKIGTNTAAGLGMNNTGKSDDGTWTYEEQYDANNIKGAEAKTKAYAVNYHQKTGKWPAGWKAGYGIATGLLNPTYVGDTQTNKIVFNGKASQKIEVGYGNYAAAWTYDPTKKLWVNGKSTMTSAQFKAYLQKQNPAYVKQLK